MQKEMMANHYRPAASGPSSVALVLLLIYGSVLAAVDGKNFADKEEEHSHHHGAVLRRRHHHHRHRELNSSSSDSSSVYPTYSPTTYTPTYVPTQDGGNEQEMEREYRMEMISAPLTAQVESADDKERGYDRYYAWEKPDTNTSKATYSPTANPTTRGPTSNPTTEPTQRGDEHDAASSSYSLGEVNACITNCENRRYTQAKQAECIGGCFPSTIRYYQEKEEEEEEEEEEEGEEYGPQPTPEPTRTKVGGPDDGLAKSVISCIPFLNYGTESTPFACPSSVTRNRVQAPPTQHFVHVIE